MTHVWILQEHSLILLVTVDFDEAQTFVLDRVGRAQTWHRYSDDGPFGDGWFSGPYSITRHAVSPGVGH